MLDPISIRVYVRNYYRIRQALENADRLYRGAFRDAIKHTLLVLKNYAHYITHRRTGTLARSHTVFYNPRRLAGYVYPSPRYFNIRSSGRIQRADEYAVYEHARGATHAFYDRTMTEMGPHAGREGIGKIVQRMPRGNIS